MRKTRLAISAVVIVLLVFLLSMVAAQNQYNEAPQLAQQVEAGQLPPVDERMPVSPLIIEPVERVGHYGGTWNNAILGPGNAWRIFNTIGLEGLLRWDLDWQELQPNVAEAVEVSEDGREFTIRLREGMRWSDGHPFTADDLVFAYNDIFMNEQILPQPPGAYVSQGEPGVIEKIDDYTVRLTFAGPMPLLLRHFRNDDLVRHPKHYFERFHADHNPDIDDVVRQEGASDWVELLQSKGAGFSGFGSAAATWQNPDLPMLSGWVPSVPLGEGTRVVAERNPYYWKVDTEGNQLPYIDRVTYEVLQDQEVMLLRTIAGELHLVDRHVTTLANRSVFFDNMERGNYRFFDLIPDKMNAAVIYLNLTHEDPVKREIFQNRDFRTGLSYAIDRQEIIDLVFVGQGEPYQAAPRPESPFYNERLALQHTDFDLDLANEYLDRAGYTQRDGQGFRRGPDGNRITIVLEASTSKMELLDVLEVLQGQWQEVGIDLQFRSMEHGLFLTRTAANLHDATIWDGDGGLAIYDEPRNYAPVHGESHFARRWAQWFLGQPEGEEPPAATMRQFELWRDIRATVDEAARAELASEFLEIAADEFYTIGVSLPSLGYGIVRNDFHNFPDVTFFAASYPYPVSTMPEQYFIGDGQ